MTKRYRAYLFARPIGPWRQTREAAEDDALAGGAASRGTELWDRGKAYLGAGAVIVIEEYRGDALFSRVVV